MFAVRALFPRDLRAALRPGIERSLAAARVSKCVLAASGRSSELAAIEAMTAVVETPMRGIRATRGLTSVVPS